MAKGASKISGSGGGGKPGNGINFSDLSLDQAKALPNPNSLRNDIKNALIAQGVDDSIAYDATMRFGSGAMTMQKKTIRSDAYPTEVKITQNGKTKVFDIKYDVVPVQMSTISGTPIGNPIMQFKGIKLVKR